MSSPKILVTAPGGNIGSVLVPLLAQKEDIQLVLPTSNAARLASTLTPSTNVSIEEGSIKDPQWVEQIIRKYSIDAIFLCLTSADELIVALNFFDAAKRAGSVKHLVYVSACGDFVSQTGLRKLMFEQNAMHVVVKATIEQKLKHSAFPWTTTILGPTLFFTNDLRSKQSMLTRNFFAEPLGKAGVSHVSIPDIALAASNTLLHPEKWAGRKIMIGSLRRFTGAETAALWSEALGREITMQEDCGKYEAAVLQAQSEASDVERAWVRDIRLMLEAFGEYGFGMTEEEHELQVEVLGKQPDDYVEWVRETGKQWV